MPRRPVQLILIAAGSILAAILAVPPTAIAGEAILKCSVAAGDRLRIDATLTVEVPAETILPAAIYLVETTSRTDVAVSVQRDGQNPRWLAWVLSGETRPGETRRFELRAGVVPDAGPRGPARLSVGADEVAVRIAADGVPLLVYHCQHRLPPEGIDAKNGRSAYLHPVLTPSGQIVTDEFPPDHPHQSGLFLAYTKTEFEGRTPDFWNLPGGTGRVRFGRLAGLSAGPVFAGFSAEQEHVDLTGLQEKVALREAIAVRVWNVGGRNAGYWLIDIQSDQAAATAAPLKLPEHHYGGAALRGARAWSGDLARFVTSEGKGRVEGNHTRPRWVDLSGPAADGVAGIAMLSHPGNFRHPEPMRLHPTMPYLVATPSFLGDWEIRPGQPHTVRYRFVVHDGPLSPELADRLWDDFASPPAVAWESP
ncbi:MAG: PmoA family protein [Planctomycetales bacterium]